MFRNSKYSNKDTYFNITNIINSAVEGALHGGITIGAAATTAFFPHSLGDFTLIGMQSMAGMAAGGLLSGGYTLCSELSKGLGLSACLPSLSPPSNEVIWSGIKGAAFTIFFTQQFVSFSTMSDLLFVVNLLKFPIMAGAAANAGLTYLEERHRQKVSVSSHHSALFTGNKNSQNQDYAIINTNAIRNNM